MIHLKWLKTSLLANTLSFLAIVALFGTQTVNAQEYKKMTRMGTSESVCLGGIQTAGQLQDYFANNPNAVRSILSDAGWSGNAQDLLDAVANGDMVETSYPVGTRMAWSGAKVAGQYVAKPYREWAGKKSFEAFKVNVSSGCKVHEIAIPKACCNVSLVSVSQDASAECSETIAPVAKHEKAVELLPFVALLVGSETQPRYEEAWDMFMKDSSGIAGLRAGLMQKITDKTSAFGQVGYYNRNGINQYNTYSKDNFGIDLGVETMISEGLSIGGGIGAWNVDESEFSDTSFFGHVVGDIGKADTNFQWFVEGRFFSDDSPQHDSLSDNKMFSVGVRYLVK